MLRVEEIDDVDGSWRAPWRQEERHAIDRVRRPSVQTHFPECSPAEDADAASITGLRHVSLAACIETTSIAGVPERGWRPDLAHSGDDGRRPWRLLSGVVLSRPASPSCGPAVVAEPPKSGRFFVGRCMYDNLCDQGLRRVQWASIARWQYARHAVRVMLVNQRPCAFSTATDNAPGSGARPSFGKEKRPTMRPT